MIDNEQIRRRHLPHWDVPHAAYFVTSCLEGSIPAVGLLEIARYGAELKARSRPDGETESDWAADCWKLMFARREAWLDSRSAVRHLANPRLAQIVVDGLYYFAGRRYDLLAFVVMASHIHWVFQPITAWVNGLGPQHSERSPRERIVHSVNRFTSGECNKALGREGTFWQHETYDHWIRDTDEMERIILYVEGNPVSAGLVAAPEQWPFSSAKQRNLAKTEMGVPLPKRGASF